MKSNFDEKLYNNYLNGNVEAFEALYLKYKDKIRYFIFNIIKDYEKAEDITQDVFIYILGNKMKKGVDFKYYIYLVAKSKALNYLNKKQRRDDIREKYLEKDNIDIEKDALDIIIKSEEKKELLEAISLLNEKYKNMVYLVKIEEFSYEETANILNISIREVKNYMYRGKKELRRILLKKGWGDMNKLSKVLIVIICTSIVLSGIAYATTKIYESIKGKASLTPTFTEAMGETDVNKMWIGTFQIAWNELMNEIVKEKVEFKDGESSLATELNKQYFTRDMISEDSYYIKVGKTTETLKQEILKDINEKFGINGSESLNEIDFSKGLISYTIYSLLNKEFEYLYPFDKLKDSSFNDNEEMVQYFGIDKDSDEVLNENVDVLFYNNDKDFAVKLKTESNDEIILYCNESDETFINLYEELNNKTKDYLGYKVFMRKDELKVPYINVDTIINYGELCGKEINKSGWYIANAIQNVKFSLNESGVKLVSEATVTVNIKGISEPRYFYYDKPFVIFLKEKDKERPYLALKVNNTDLLIVENCN